MAKLIAPVQPLILKVAGEIPTIPTPNTIMPDDSRFNKESNLMVGQLAYNIIDDIWYYRGYSSILPLNQSAEITIDQVEVWQDNKVYTAGNVYVSYVNESSANPQFQIEAIYRCITTTTVGESPESTPLKWEYQGQYVDLSYLTFVALQDTPANYTGSANKIVTVKTDETGLEFSTNINAESIQFDLDSVEELSEGKLKWNADYGTLDLGLPGGNVVLQIGQETLVRVCNTEAFTINDGQPVYISGSTGDNPEVKLASASSITTSYVAGVITESIAPNNFGYMCVTGMVRGINTDGLSYGLPLWLGTTAGTFTQTIPDAPNISVFIGYVVRTHAEEGIIITRPVVIPRLSNLSDVNGTPLTVSGQILVWDNVSGYFDFTYNINDYALLEDIIDEHNLLTGLQGGTTGQYYHLTEAQYNALSLPNGHIIEDSTTTYTQRSNLKFLGGVVVSDNAAEDTTEVTITVDGASSWEEDTGVDEWGQTKIDDIKPKDSKKVHVEHIDKLVDEEDRVYGYLYKWYTIVDSKGFVNGTTWRAPSDTDWSTLVSYIGTDSAIKLKTAEGWSTNNGTDIYGFSVKPGGIRSVTAGAEAVFANVLNQGIIWSTKEEISPTGSAKAYLFIHNFSDLLEVNYYKTHGCSIRLVRDASVEEQALTDGTELDEYVGNDGKTYRTVKIGTQVWTAENLLETKFADGTDIAILTDATAWNTSTASVRCSYDNDETTYAVNYTEGELHKVAKSGNYYDLENLPNFIPIVNYVDTLTVPQTIALERNEATLIVGELTDTNNITIELASPTSNIYNQYSIHFEIGDSLPIFTHPSGVVWQNASPPAFVANRKYTIIYEYLESSEGVWEIRGNVGEYFSSGTPINYITEAPIDGNTYGRKDGSWVTVEASGTTDLITNEAALPNIGTLANANLADVLELIDEKIGDSGGITPPYVIQFTTTLPFDKFGQYFETYAQTGVLSFIKGVSTFGIGAWIIGTINLNGDDIYFSDDFILLSNDYSDFSPGLYDFMFVLWPDGKIRVTIKSLTVVYPYPTILSIDTSGLNDYVIITFSEGVYGDTLATTGVSASDFKVINFISGGASNVVIASINRVDNSAVTGGETQIKINLTPTGIPDGTESFKISAFDDNSVFNSNGIALPEVSATPLITMLGEPSFPLTGLYAAFKVTDPNSWVHISSVLDEFRAINNPSILFSGNYAYAVVDGFETAPASQFLFHPNSSSPVDFSLTETCTIGYRGQMKVNNKICSNVANSEYIIRNATNFYFQRGGVAAIAPWTVKDDVVHTFIFVVTGTTLEVFVDNVSQGTVTVGAGTFEVGRLFGGSATQQFNSVALYNAALDSVDRTQLHNWLMV